MLINTAIQGVAQLYGANFKTAAAKPSECAAKGASDEVVLSETAQSFAHLLQKAQQDMDSVRTDKVERLSLAIASGAYEVDADAIAEKMLNGFY